MHKSSNSTRQAKDFASALQWAFPGAIPPPEAAGFGREREKGKEKGKEEA